MSARSISNLAGRIFDRAKDAAERYERGDRVHYYSYDKDDRRANPGRPIGDGSSAHGWAFKNAMLEAAKALLVQQNSAGQRRGKLQAVDVIVLEKMFSCLDYRTGIFIVDYKTIDEKIGKFVKGASAAKRSVARLEAAGLIAHVRRSEKREPSEGQESGESEKGGSKRFQIANYYYFRRDRMDKAIWEVFWKAFTTNLSRIARAARNRAHMALRTFNHSAAPSPRPSSRKPSADVLLQNVKDDGLRQTLTSLQSQLVLQTGSPSP